MNAGDAEPSMIYLDTSVVVALLTPEERSTQALDWFGQSREPLISSDWLITETHSALGIKQRLTTPAGACSRGCVGAGTA